MFKHPGQLCPPLQNKHLMSVKKINGQVFELLPFPSRISRGFLSKVKRVNNEIAVGSRTLLEERMPKRAPPRPGSCQHGCRFASLPTPRIGDRTGCALATLSWVRAGRLSTLVPGVRVEGNIT